jgi:hypothetical protein
MLPLRVRIAEFLKTLASDPAGGRRLIGLAMVLALLGTLIATGDLSLRIGSDSSIAGRASDLAAGETGIDPGAGDLAGATGVSGGVDGPDAAAGGTGTTSRGAGAASGGGASAGASSVGGSAGAVGAGAKAASCAGAKLTATDRGVHEKTVDVALFTVDLAALNAAGFGLSTGTADFGPIVNAWEKEINSHGGIACRQLNLIHVVGQLEENDQAAKCKAMSQDMKVFGVLSPGGNVVGGPCTAIEEKQPIVTALAAPDRWRTQGAPYMWDILMSQEQYMKNQVRWLVESGDVKPGNPATPGVTRLGIVYADENYSGYSVEKAMIPELKRLGVTPVRTAKLPYDAGQAAAQVPQVVVDFQTNNVDTIVMPMNLIYKTQFMQQAQQQGYHPRYRDSDYTVSCQTATTGTYPPAQWDGTKCVTSGGYSFLAPNGLSPAQLEKYLATNAYAKYATKVFNAANPTGYSDGGERDADDTNAERAAHMLTGTLLNLMVQAANRAGPHLTRQTWGKAMGETKDFTLSLSPKPLTFGPGEWTGPDFLHVVQWERDASSGYEANSYRAHRPAFKAWY